MEQAVSCCLRRKSTKHQLKMYFLKSIKLPLNSKFFISCLLDVNHYLLINSLAEFKALPVLVFGNCAVIYQKRKKNKIKFSEHHLTVFLLCIKNSIRHSVKPASYTKALKTFLPCTLLTVTWEEIDA